MNPATTVTWQSWCEKWGHWNNWRRPGSNSVTTRTFDDLRQPRLPIDEPTAIAPNHDHNGRLDAISRATETLLTAAR